MKTSTEKTEYVVALCVDMEENNDITYENYDIVEASSPIEAQNKYNKKHKCSYFYGACLAKVVNGNITILNNRLTCNQVQRLLVAHKTLLNAQANARLIAAAPELLDALIKVRCEFASKEAYRENGMVAMIDETIKKATQP